MMQGMIPPGIPYKRISISPVLKQNGSTVAATVTVGYAIVIGKIAFVFFRLTPTANGTANTQIQVDLTGLGINASANGAFAGTFLYLDSGSAGYSGVVTFEAASAVLLRFDVHNSGSPLGIAPNFAINGSPGGDYLAAGLMYEIA